MDPLDGTKEFINGSQEFTVNIALINKGEPVLGVIHQPPANITTFGSQESGAFIAGDDEGYPPAHQRTHACLPLANAIAREKKLNLPCFFRII